VKKLGQSASSFPTRSSIRPNAGSWPKRGASFLFCSLLTVSVAGSLCLTREAFSRVRLVPQEHKTIQKAIDVAEWGDTILVSPGTYKETLTLRTTVSLISTKGAAKTIIDAGRRGVALICEHVDSTATIQGFTFKNGVGLNGGGLLLSSSFARVEDNVFTADSAQYGGGLCALWSNSVIKNNKFVNNKAQYGGAIYAMFISPTFDSNLLQENRAEIGGGFYFSRSCEAKTNGNRIIGNIAKTGGGAYLNKCSPSLAGNIFKSNRAEEGGGIFAYHAGGIIKENVFLENKASRGAGVALVDTVGPDVVNNTIVRNSAPDSLCSGIYFSSTYMNVTNNVIADNSPGYAIYCTSGATPVLSCNILWNNPTGNYYGVVTRTADLYEDPLFCSPGKEDFTVQEGSPALGRDCGNIGAKNKGCSASKTSGRGRAQKAKTGAK